MSGLTLGGPLSTGDHSGTWTTPSPPPRVSDLEAKIYYEGLPSRPVLIARTDSPWDGAQPGGTQAQGAPYGRLS